MRRLTPLRYRSCTPVLSNMLPHAWCMEGRKEELLIPGSQLIGWKSYSIWVGRCQISAMTSCQGTLECIYMIYRPHAGPMQGAIQQRSLIAIHVAAFLGTCQKRASKLHLIQFLSLGTVESSASAWPHLVFCCMCIFNL